MSLFVCDAWAATVDSLTSSQLVACVLAALPLLSQAHSQAVTLMACQVKTCEGVAASRRSAQCCTIQMSFCRHGMFICDVLPNAQVDAACISSLCGSAGCLQGAMEHCWMNPRSSLERGIDAV